MLHTETERTPTNTSEYLYWSRGNSAAVFLLSCFCFCLHKIYLGNSSSNAVQHILICVLMLLLPLLIVFVIDIDSKNKIHRVDAVHCIELHCWNKIWMNTYDRRGRVWCSLNSIAWDVPKQYEMCVCVMDGWMEYVDTMLQKGYIQHIGFHAHWAVVFGWLPIVARVPCIKYVVWKITARGCVHAKISEIQTLGRWASKHRRVICLLMCRRRYYSLDHAVFVFFSPFSENVMILDHSRSLEYEYIPTYCNTWEYILNIHFYPSAQFCRR